MSKDIRGNPVSYGDGAAVRELDRITAKFHAYQADPLAEIDALLASHPDFVMAHAVRAAMIATAADRAFEPELRRSTEAAEALATQANDRERSYIAAARAMLDGGFEQAAEHWGRAALDHPRDLLAVQLAQLGDFLLGSSLMLRDRVSRVLPHWDRSVPGYGFLLGMQAFGLEESGEYARAEACGREGVALNPQDGWAAHAVAHVMEMTGRTGEGIGFLLRTADDWSPGSMFAYHNWWHLALFHLDQGDSAEVLRLYDERIAATGFTQALELIDGSALLWRLHLLGHDAGRRWEQLGGWAARRQDAHYAFNDVHAMMAAVGTGDRAVQREILQALEHAVAGSATNAMMAREVGLPAARGLAAFGDGDYRSSIEALMPLRAKASRFGGSHAQRDIIAWTLVEAAIREGDRTLARGLLAERMAAKPRSGVNLRWQERLEGSVAAVAA
jgi:hypothetical protein